MSKAFQLRLQSVAADIERALAELLSDKANDNAPGRLLEAMRHGVLNGGKRLRPFLVVEAAALFDVPQARAMPAACALELVHCYSLIHDDLPAMDDDDLRRGKPTVHIAFDEATAILAGDALLTLAFDHLAQAYADAPEIALALVARLARASGAAGMIGGQMLDIEAETSPFTEAGIMRLQAMKTGALLEAAVAMGAALGQADAQSRQRLSTYGRHLGAAFQLADDLLDVSATSDDLGKATNKDDARGKATLVRMLGEAPARERLNTIVEAAESTLEDFGDEASTLRAAARFAANRTN